MEHLKGLISIRAYILWYFTIFMQTIQKKILAGPTSGECSNIILTIFPGIVLGPLQLPISGDRVMVDTVSVFCHWYFWSRSVFDGHSTGCQSTCGCQQGDLLINCTVFNFNFIAGEQCAWQNSSWQEKTNPSSLLHNAQTIILKASRWPWIHKKYF